MDQKLKERLLGAVIILSVMVFILPILFKQPAPVEVILEAPSEDEDNKEAHKIPLTHKILTPSIPKISISNPSTPKTVKTARVWVLRMGIFTNKDNAKLLAEKLFSKGYRVYSNVDKRKGTTFTRIFVGPYQNEYEVKKLRDRLKKELNIEGLVLLVEPGGNTV
jgi:DedD protein